MPRTLSNFGNTPAVPSGWKMGYTFPHQLSEGETPFLYQNRWYLRVFNVETRNHEVYCFMSDMFEDEIVFNERVRK